MVADRYSAAVVAVRVEKQMEQRYVQYAEGSGRYVSESFRHVDRVDWY